MLDRRDLLKILAGAAVTPSLQLTAAEPGAPLYFTRQEFAALDDLSEIIIPSDNHSPGARTAGVPAFIDKSVAEALLPENKERWRRGLAPYLSLNHQQRVALLREDSRNEANPQTDAEKFFGQLKESVAFAYYTSKIGIKSDIGYSGNVIQQEFTGYELT